MGAEVLPLYILMKGECRRHHSGSGGALTAWGPVGCAAASTTGAGTGNGAEFGGAGGASRAAARAGAGLCGPELALSTAPEECVRRHRDRDDLLPAGARAGAGAGSPPERGQGARPEQLLRRAQRDVDAHRACGKRRALGAARTAQPRCGLSLRASTSTRPNTTNHTLILRAFINKFQLYYGNLPIFKYSGTKYSGHNL